MTRYQYETSPRKLEPEFLPRKKVKRDLCAIAVECFFIA